MRVLIVGGTGFNGRHFVVPFQQRGHAVTVFGLAAPQPAFADVEMLIGDREREIEVLKNRDWDVVIDNFGLRPRHVRLTAEALRGRVGRYIFISSICAYRDFATPGINEDYPLGVLTDPTTEEVGQQTYGPLKALCEQVVEEIYGSRATILRPTYIVGPGDPTDRFTYWPVRVARGGEMLVPGAPTDYIQFIDVRDVADFVCRCAEHAIGGRYNLCNPPGAVTMGELLETSKRLSGADTRFVWAPLDFLPENHRMGGGGDLTIWAPRGDGYRGWPLISSARAVERGLRFRNLEATVRDLLAWHAERPLEQRSHLRAGMTPEREAQLLAQDHQSIERCSGSSAPTGDHAAVDEKLRSADVG
jgi:2'-hydroxyisoflavone reductase